MQQLNITIVTVNFNDQDGLEKTIMSIENQIYSNIEFIIIDGNSTDHSAEVIKKYEEKIDYWISEKDNGIYDAMNKGIKQANGDFIIFMNAGDIFYDKYVLENICNKIKDKDKIYFGRAKINNNDSSWLYPNKKIDANNINIWLKHNLPNHQAMFFPKSFFKSYSYNTSYKIGSDSDYKFQAQKDNGFIFIDDIICEFEFGGVSSEFSSFKVVKQILKDSWKISLKHKGLLYALMRQIKILTKYILNILVGNNTLKKLINKFRK